MNRNSPNVFFKINLVLAKSSSPIFLSLSTDFFALIVLLENFNKLKHIGVSFPCDLLQLVVPSLKVVVSPGVAHQESSPQCSNLTFTAFYFLFFLVQFPLLYKLVQLVSTVLVTLSRQNGTER